MTQQDIARITTLMRNRDHNLLHDEAFNHGNLLALADEVPGLLDEVVRLKTLNEQMNEALRKIHDLSGQVGGSSANPEMTNLNLGAIQDWCHQSIGACK